jgi:hypothetical protein
MLDEARNVGDAMLAIRIDLQHMTVPGARRMSNSGNHSAAFAAVGLVAQQENLLRRFGRQPVKHPGARGRAAVIDQDAWQAGSQHSLDD